MRYADATYVFVSFRWLASCTWERKELFTIFHARVYKVESGLLLLFWFEFEERFMRQNLTALICLKTNARLKESELESRFIKGNAG